MSTNTTIIIGIGIMFYTLTCLAFMDIARKDFGSIGKKVLWGFIAFTPFAGCIIYFVFGFRKGKIIRVKGIEEQKLSD
jgi:uncharacterized membrane protein YbhN (UPF0104 family)